MKCCRPRNSPRCLILTDPDPHRKRDGANRHDDGRRAIRHRYLRIAERPTDPRAQERDPLEVLASEFVEGLRQGAEPAIDSLVEAHPELAAEIHELFPLLTAMEGWKAYRETTSYEHRSLETFREESSATFASFARSAAAGWESFSRRRN